MPIFFVPLFAIGVIGAVWMAGWRGHRYSTRHRRGVAGDGGAGTATRNQRKPDWVRRELIRFKAMSPQLGYRAIAEVFNRQFAR